MLATDPCLAAMLEDALIEDAARMVYPVRFAEWVMSKNGYTLEPWQRLVFETDRKYILMNVHRQGGKSVVSSMLALHQAIYYPESLILLLSPSQRQSGELFRKCMDRLFWIQRDESMPGLTFEVGVDAQSALRLELSNRSRIVSLPGKSDTIVGYSDAKLIVIDEAARVPDTMYGDVRPMLLRGHGRLVLLSTPWGQSGFYYREATRPDDGVWMRVTHTALESAWIDPAFLEEERKSMSDWQYRQNYLCEFCADEFAAFNYEDVDRALRGEVVESWSL